MHRYTLSISTAVCLQVQSWWARSVSPGPRRARVVLALHRAWVCRPFGTRGCSPPMTFFTGIVWRRTGCAALVSALPADERLQRVWREPSAVRVTGCLSSHKTTSGIHRCGLQHSYGRKRTALNTKPSPGAPSPSANMSHSLFPFACAYTCVCA